MKNILVTGGAGYVGSILLRELLKNNYNVTCIDNLMFGGDSIISILDHKNFLFIKSDINNISELEKIFSLNKFDVVIHLAAIVGDPACKLDPELAVKTNWISSKWLVDKSRSSGVSNFILASTCSNYGKMSDPKIYVDEKSKLAPVSLYAELKVKLENYILNQMTRTQKFIPTCLRFATVYGLSPRMRFDLTLNEFTKNLTLGKELLVYGEQFWRPYCHVKDFSNAFLKVLASPKNKIAYNVFNVGDTEENYTKQMLIEEIKKILPNSKIKYVKTKDDPRDYRVNCDKINKELGFSVTKTVPEGILEIKRVINEGIINNTEDQKYYNIPHEKK